MENTTIGTWVLIIILYSFIGFLLENLWMLFRFGYCDNRNMNLPFLLGYGVAVVLFYLILGIPEQYPDFSYLICTFFLVSLGEIFLGKLVERICKIHYWDYSALPFHFTRYTSLFTSLGFALLITVLMRSTLPVAARFFEGHDTPLLKYAAVMGVITLSADCVSSFSYMRRNRKPYSLWRLTVFEKGAVPKRESCP